MKRTVKILTVLCCMVGLLACLALPGFCANPEQYNWYARISVPSASSDYDPANYPYVTNTGGNAYVVLESNGAGDLPNRIVIENVSNIVTEEMDLMNVRTTITGNYGVIYVTYVLGDGVSIEYDGSRGDNLSNFVMTIYSDTEITVIPDSNNVFTAEVVNNGGGGNATVSSITGVFSNISAFVVSSLASVQGVFFLEGDLTLLGTLAVIGLSVALAFLIIGVIQRFLKLRG